MLILHNLGWKYIVFGDDQLLSLPAKALFKSINELFNPDAVPCEQMIKVWTGIGF